MSAQGPNCDILAQLGHVRLTPDTGTDDGLPKG
jgi:hypothetical protein